MEKVIVIGNNHHNTLGLVRSLGRGGLEVICLIVSKKIGRSFISKSRYIKEFQLFRTFHALLNYLKGKSPIIPIPILTTSDEGAEFIDLHYDELSHSYILNNCGHKKGGISFWMNKEIMLEKAKECGFRIPFGIIINIEQINNVIFDDISFPCIIKPHKSSEAKKTTFRICNSVAQLKESLNEISSVCKEVLIQEYITCDYEFLIMGLRSSKSGQLLLPGGLHKLRVCKHTQSLGMLAYAYTTSEIAPGIDTNAIKRFLDIIDYDGIFSVEFLIKGDKAYLLEFNFRNDGTQFCFEGAGVNIPELWTKITRGEEIDSLSPRLDKKYCIVEVNYLKNMDWHHPLTAIKEWKNASLFALVDKQDLKPAFYKLFYSLWK